MNKNWMDICIADKRSILILAEQTLYKGIIRARSDAFLEFDGQYGTWVIPIDLKTWEELIAEKFRGKYKSQRIPIDKIAYSTS